MSDNSLDLHVNTTANAAGFKEATAAQKELTDETKRYQETLFKMASRKEDEEMLARSAERKKDLAERTKEQAEQSQYAAQADKELAQSVGQVTQAQANEILAGKSNIETTREVVSAKAELKDVLKGLQNEFPALAAVGRLALNPIALASAGIAATWGLWKTRIEQATAALANVELPQTKTMDPGHISARAEAWGQYALAVAKAAESHNSLDAGLDRTLKQLKEQLDLTKQIADAEAKAEEARVKAEVARGTMTQAEGAARSAETREQAEAAKLAAEIKAEEAKLDAQYQQAYDLEESAKGKRANAGKIRVASARDDDKTESKLAALAQASEKGIEENRGWIGKLLDYQALPEWKRWLSPMAWTGSMMWRYGDSTVEEALDQERRAMATNQVNVDRYNQFLRRRGDRNNLRDFRGTLIDEAAKEQSAADAWWNTEGETAERSWRARKGTMEKTNMLGNLQRARETLAEGEKQAAEVTKQIAEQIKSRGAAEKRLLQVLEEQQAFNTELWRRCDQLERQITGKR